MDVRKRDLRVEILSFPLFFDGTIRIFAWESRHSSRFTKRFFSVIRDENASEKGKKNE